MRDLQNRSALHSILGAPLPPCSEKRRTAPVGAALTLREERTLLVRASCFDLILKFLDFFFLVFIGRIFQQSQSSFHRDVALIA